VIRKKAKNARNYANCVADPERLSRRRTRERDYYHENPEVFAAARNKWLSKNPKKKKLYSDRAEVKKRNILNADRFFKLIITANAIGNIITDPSTGRPSPADTG
jgi:hypothetical protein